MGWYESVHGGVMGDPIADLIDDTGWDGSGKTPTDIPPELLDKIDDLYVEGMGRLARWDDLKAVVGYARNHR